MGELEVMVGHPEQELNAAALAAYNKWRQWGVLHAHNAPALIKDGVASPPCYAPPPAAAAPERIPRLRAGVAPS